MRRVVALLLIPFLLANQSQSFAHTHEGTGIAEPVGHSARPHWHTRGDSDHHHVGQSPHSHHTPHHADRDVTSSKVWLPVEDHDADAMYLPTAMTFGLGRSATVTGSEQQAVSAWFLRTADSAAMCCVCSRYFCDLPPPDQAARCPLYLRNLSIRI